jgi:hypothetical protein
VARLTPKSEVAQVLMREAAAAHPGTLERQDWEATPEICRADGRTVAEQIKRLAASGCLTPLYKQGRVERLQATDTAAVAILAATGRLP